MELIQTRSKRFRARSTQRGTAVFIVMMALVVLTGAGMWAVTSAGLTDAAGGNARAAAQTLYMSELGLSTTAAYLSVPGHADSNFAQVQQSNRQNTPDDCLSVYRPALATDPPEFCKRMDMSEIDSSIQMASATNFPVLDTGAEGSMGPYGALGGPGGADDSRVAGAFIAEMTDPRPVSVPGEDMESQKYQRVTLTSYGIIRPSTADLCAGPDARSQNAVTSQLASRGHIIVGPLAGQ